MNPLPDRVVVLGLLITIAACFALVFWSVKLSPRQPDALRWRDEPPVQAVPRPAETPTARRGGLLL